MPAKQLSPRSEDGLAMITDQVEQHASYTSVDPAYIERLQDDIKISVRPTLKYLCLLYTDPESVILIFFAPVRKILYLV